jgi:phosphopantetheine--protein transferase-like protein
MRVELKPFHRDWPAEVCTFGSDSRRGLIERLERFASFLRSGVSAPLKDVAYTLNVAEWSPSTYRLTFVASTLAEAADRVLSALTRLAQEGCKRIHDPRGVYFFANPPKPDGGLAFLFPGEGSQYPGMLSDLCLWFPEVRAWFDLMDRAFIDHPRNHVPSQFIFPLPTGQTPIGPPPSRLWQTDGAVEAVFTGSQALLSLLEKLEIRPDAVVGHSAGDYSALFASGALRTGDDAQFIRQARELNCIYEEFSARGGVPEGVLLAVNSADPALPAAVIERSNGALHLALENCPHQVILCGTQEDIDRASEILRMAGAVCEVLPFRRAYHTPMFETVSERLLELLQNVVIAPPAVPVYSCVTAGRYPADPEKIRKLAAVQWSRPVRFLDTIEAMYHSGIRIFVEVGPRSNLTAFVDDVLRGRPSVSIASNVAGRSGIVQIQHLVAQLFAAGVPMRLDELYVRREPKRVLFESRTETKPARAVDRVKLSLRLPTLQVQRPEPAMTQSAPLPQVLSTTWPPVVPIVAHSAATNPDSRRQVLESYFQNTLKMLDTEREVMIAYLASRADRSEPVREVYDAAAQAGGPSVSSNAGETIGAPPEVSSIATNCKLPFVRKIASVVPRHEVKVLCEIDLREDLFLMHHTLAGRISSTDTTLVGLPVIPLTVSMEILAEVASLLKPGRLVVGMKDIQASRWLMVEQDSLVLEVTARSSGRGEEVRVVLRESSVSATVPMRDTLPAVEGTVIFAERYPDGSKTAHLVLSEERPSKWPAGRMYDGTGMFHGPPFQVVSSIDRTGKDGTEATLTGRAAEGFFRRNSGNQLIDPVVLDAMGQVVGYWVGDQFETGLSVFPFRLARLDLYRGALRAGEKAQCRVRVLSVDDQWIRSNIEVVADDKPIVHMTGWEDRRLDLPRRFYDFRISTVDVLLSDSWPVPVQALPEPGAFRCAVLERLSEETFEAHRSIWLLVLAYMVLNRSERQFWRTLKCSGKRRLEWLLGRIAAKDAVRLFLRDTVGVRLCPADIEIVANEHGALEVKGRWAEHVDAMPAVSISHTSGLAMAVAGRSSESSSVGVDIEQIGRITAEVERLVLSADERELLAKVENGARSEWTTRLWCAKEAVGKALGRGVLPVPATLRVREADLRTGRVAVAVSKELTSDLARPGNTYVTAYTGAEGNHAFGIALV